MTAAFLAAAFGLALLVWSADRFVEGSASTARHFGMPPLLIGMVVVSFGTSAQPRPSSSESEAWRNLDEHRLVQVDRVIFDPV
jgi:Ca2+/Na+ antiporter